MFYLVKNARAKTLRKFKIAFAQVSMVLKGKKCALFFLNNHPQSASSKRRNQGKTPVLEKVITNFRILRNFYQTWLHKVFQTTSDRGQTSCTRWQISIYFIQRGQGFKSKQSTNAALNHHLVLDNQFQKGKGVWRSQKLLYRISCRRIRFIVITELVSLGD